jgi:gluconate:H+ symporter, GntP family
MLVILLIVSVVIIVLFTTKLDIHPFLALLAAALFFALFSGMELPAIVDAVNTGFGVTLGKIGLVIILGVIIGKFLENTGAAYKLANVVLRIIGEKNVHAAMGIIGYIVSIPVFADSGFIILNPLNKSLSKKAKVSLAGTAVALILGLMLTHVMVPPTPGPIAAAGILKADIGLVMLCGLVVSALSLVVAIIYSQKYVSKIYIDPNPDLSEKDVEEKIANSPSAFKSFLPILIPIILIIGKSIVEYGAGEAEKSTFQNIVGFIGSPTIALLIGALLAFMLPKKFEKKMLSTSGWVGEALLESSNILLITGAGGIFGTILQQSSIADSLTNMLSGANLGIWLPFILTAAIKTAQGSSTVALITAASIMAPLLHTMGFDSEMQKALMVVAIGAGAAVVPHVNDSGFWVVTQLTGMDINTGLKLYTKGALLCGTFAAIVVWVWSMFV